MKVSYTEPSGFRPITLTIVIEHEAELQDLWHRTNISSGGIEGYYEEKGKVPLMPDYGCQIIWHALDKVARERHIPMYDEEDEE